MLFNSTEISLLFSDCLLNIMKKNENNFEDKSIDYLKIKENTRPEWFPLPYGLGKPYPIES